MTIKLNEPLKPDNKKLVKYIESVNESGWYTNFGPLHQLLTAKLEEYLDVSNLLLVSNGTLAIQVACKALQVESAITTPFSFVATTSSLLWQGIETKFSDIDQNSFNLCPQNLDTKLAESSQVHGVVATHVYGNPCNVVELEKVCKKHHSPLVYDAAHAFGIKLNKKSVLQYGDASTLSFHATKVFHTIEGGAIVFNDKQVFERAKKLINFGIDENGKLGSPGINAKLNEYQCAVGLTLLDQIDYALEHRVTLFEAYRKELSDYCILQEWHPNANYNGSYMPVLVDQKKKREELMLILKKNSIQFKTYFSPSLDLAYEGLTGYENCAVSNGIAGNIICLPLHAYLSLEDVRDICRAIKKVLK